MMHNEAALQQQHPISHTVTPPRVSLSWTHDAAYTPLFPLAGENRYTDNVGTRTTDHLRHHHEPYIFPAFHFLSSYRKEQK